MKLSSKWFVIFTIVSIFLTLRCPIRWADPGWQGVTLETSGNPRSRQFLSSRNVTFFLAKVVSVPSRIFQVLQNHGVPFDTWQDVARIRVESKCCDGLEPTHVSTWHRWYRCEAYSDWNCLILMCSYRFWRNRKHKWPRKEHDTGSLMIFNDIININSPFVFLSLIMISHDIINIY